MKKIDLKAEIREAWEKLNKLREDKKIPWVVYGRKQEPISIKLNNSEIVSLINKHWKTNIISLNVWRKKIDSIIHDHQNDPVKWNFIHIDFYAITAWEKITTEIPLKFVWESEAAKMWATIEERLKEIELRCLSEDLVDAFEVDISLLKEAEDMIKVEDLWIDLEKYDLITPLEEVVASSYMPVENVIEEDVPEETEVEWEETKDEEKEWEETKDEEKE